MNQIKRLVLIAVAACGLAMLLGYRMGRRYAISEIRHEYPYLENVQKEPRYKGGGVWLTHNPTKDTFAVNVLRETGRWERIYIYPEN